MIPLSIDRSIVSSSPALISQHASLFIDHSSSSTPSVTLVSTSSDVVAQSGSMFGSTSSAASTSSPHVLDLVIDLSNYPI
jgi:hypothetical protein